MLPDIVSGVYGVISFMSLWGTGISNFLELTKAMTKYRQYAYRYLSHGDLTSNRSGNVEISNYRRKISRSYYLDNLLQNFPASDITQTNYRVNNLYRGRAVMFEIDRNNNNTAYNILDPALADNSLTTIGVQFDIDRIGHACKIDMKKYLSIVHVSTNEYKHVEFIRDGYLEKYKFKKATLCYFINIFKKLYYDKYNKEIINIIKTLKI